MIAPGMDLFADIRDERREQLFVGSASESLIGGKPALGRDQRSVGRSGELRVERHDGVAFGSVRFVVSPGRTSRENPPLVDVVGNGPNSGDNASDGTLNPSVSARLGSG